MSASDEVSSARRLVLVLGDQLNDDSAVFDDFDSDHDAVLMIEARREASYVPQHKHRLVLFFAAMRHFRDGLRERGYTVHYAALDAPDNRGSFDEEIPRWLEATGAERLVVARPGDYRVQSEIEAAARAADVELERRPDRHFLCRRETFQDYAEGRKSLLLESFYRRMRRQEGWLIDEDGNPEGGQWNYDADNRETFGKSGPPDIKSPRAFACDGLTREVIELVDEEFPDSPGHTKDFDYPVTASEAQDALQDFIDHRLADFGRYQDAMAVGRPYLYHSRLSSALNLHFLDPRRVIEATLEAYREQGLPLNSVEGFVRQVVGWREYVRGIYWQEMPGYEELNGLDAELAMPSFMWTGKTEMNCVKHSVGQLIDHAYAHHIQRLMVLGLFSLLLGVRPKDVNHWHHAMYIDAVDWVSLPNVLGMSQFADGGLLATKPYCASGAYINRMSDYCKGCRYNPKQASGDDACPFTTLYWDFLARHKERLAGNRRMNFQFANLNRKEGSELRAIRSRADYLKSRL